MSVRETNTTTSQRVADAERRPIDTRLFHVNATAESVANILEEIVADGGGDVVAKAFVCAQALRVACKEMDGMESELRGMLRVSRLADTRD